jgi:hypothetical protein
MTYNGVFCAEAGHPGGLKDIVAEGEIQRQNVTITGFLTPTQRARFSPKRVSIEDFMGNELRHRDNPARGFAVERSVSSWDELDIAYNAGCSIWLCLTLPYALTAVGVQTEEVGCDELDGVRLRALRARFPTRLVAQDSEQTCRFDDCGLLRRIDYRMRRADNRVVANVASAHQTFDGITIPTLLRVAPIGTDGQPTMRRALLDIEIFDVSFV